MNSIQKKELVKKLLPIIGVIVKQFLTGGKTKLGIYILAVTTLSLNYFAGIDPTLASAKPEILPALAKVGMAVGGTVLSVGVGHDVIKKGKGIASSIRDLFKAF